MQVGADTRQIVIPEMAMLAAEVQPTRSDTPIPTSDMSKRIYVAHPQVPPSIIAEVAPSSFVYRPSTAGQRQVKSSVPIGIDEPSLGSVREKSQSGMAGVESHRAAERRPTSVATGHPLSEGVIRPSPVHARPMPTQAPMSMSADRMSAAHTVYPSGIDAYVARPTLADDEPVSYTHLTLPTIYSV